MTISYSFATIIRNNHNHKKINEQSVIMFSFFLQGQEMAESEQTNEGEVYNTMLIYI